MFRRSGVNGQGQPQLRHAIDGFRLEEQLHRGGMADIWRVPATTSTSHRHEGALLDFEGDLSLIVGFEVDR